MMRTFPMKPIRTERDHDLILKLIELLLDAAEKRSLSGPEHDLLIALLKMYEAERQSLDALYPIEGIEVVMESGRPFPDPRSRMALGTLMEAWQWKVDR